MRVKYPLIVLAVGFFLGALRGFTYHPKPDACANSISCARELSGIYDTSAKQAQFMSSVLPVPEAIPDKDTPVLGESTGEEKHIYVDLTNQHLMAFEGGQKKFDFPVSTGKWGRTPTGEFSIWIKLKYTRMTGGNKAIGTYYDLPNVPYTMFFYNKETPKGLGYGIHGAYWHNNFGHPMSHGCINMRTEDAGQLFAWADPQTTGYSAPATEDRPGTRITIYGVAPAE